MMSNLYTKVVIHYKLLFYLHLLSFNAVEKREKYDTMSTNSAAVSASVEDAQGDNRWRSQVCSV